MGACSSMTIDAPSKSDIRCGPEDVVPKQLPLARHQQTAPSDSAQRRSDSGQPGDMGRLRDKVRAGVSFSTKPLPSKSQKSEAETQVIREKLKATSVLGALSSSQIDEIIAYMSVKVISEQQSVSLMNGLHLVLEGTLVQKANGKHGPERRYTQGDIFGHVELLYGGHNEPMRATTRTKVCYLSRDVYQKYSAARSTAKLSQNMRLISSIPVFSNLSMKERGKLADACKTRRYNQGDYIITQGQKGTEFFILTSGHATLHRRDASGRNPIADPIIDRKYKGDHFGESALLNDEPRNASAIAADHGTEVLYIDKATFNRLLGPVRELLERREDETNELMMVEVDMLQNLPSPPTTIHRLPSKWACSRITP
jgi:cAMP-dependent protein kinase regulator